MMLLLKLKTNITIFGLKFETLKNCTNSVYPCCNGTLNAQIEQEILTKKN